MLLQEIGCIMVSIALFAIAIYTGITFSIWRHKQRQKIKEKFPDLFSSEFEKAQYFYLFGLAFVIFIAWVLHFIDK